MHLGNVLVNKVFSLNQSGCATYCIECTGPESLDCETCEDTDGIRFDDGYCYCDTDSENYYETLIPEPQCLGK
jgi:hypothetical protein